MANLEITTATSQDISGIQEALKLDIPVLTNYPTTDASKAGKFFWYKGETWEYLTQEKINESGLSPYSFFVVGSPVPTSFTKNQPITSNGVVVETLEYNKSRSIYRTTIGGDNFGVIDFLTTTYGKAVVKVRSIFISGSNGEYQIEGFRNAELLYELEDAGTSAAIYIGSAFTGTANVSGAILNSLFTQLPPTTKTATIDVKDTNDVANCDPTIATAKGYTVVTS